MEIYIAADHRGVKAKKYIIDYLKDNNIGIKELDLDNNELDDYVDYAIKLGNIVKKDPNRLGILICGNGIGMSIAANKIKGIRCARVLNSDDAYKAKNHNGANVIALSSETDNDKLEEIVDTFISTKFASEERHLNRINKIIKYEEGKYNEL